MPMIIRHTTHIGARRRQSADKLRDEEQLDEVVIDPALPNFNTMPAEDLEAYTRGALHLQSWWRNQNQLRFWTTGVVHAVRLKARQHAIIRHRVQEIIVYAIFLVFYTVDLVSQKGDQNVFHYPNQIKEQFTSVEFKHEPVLKTFEDVHTIKEIWQWFEGPFLDAAFSEATFDGRQKQPGTLLGHGHKVGGLRIGLIRMTNRACASHMPQYISGAALPGDTPVECFGDDTGTYVEWAEDRTDFGNAAAPFTWAGWNSTNTEAERKRPLTFSRSLNMNGPMPSTAYSVVLPNSGYGRAAAQLKAMRDANYIDLRTRLVTADLTVWNVMMRRLVCVRMMFVLPQGGGVIPDWHAVSVPDWPYPENGAAYVLTVIIACFFTLFAWQTAVKIKRHGWRSSVGGFTGIVHNLNILLYWVAWGLRFGAFMSLPSSGVRLHNDAFVDMRSYSEIMRISILTRACNSFLCWFKIVTHLSLEPKFALVTSTLGRSASHISAFIFIFAILGYAFSSCFLLTFGDSLPNYRSLSETLYSMLRGLLGDFDLESMQQAHWLMGPFLFLGFVSVAVFVILNLIIAIISDSYMEAQAELQDREDVQLGKEIKAYLRRVATAANERLTRVPVLGAVFRHAAKVVPAGDAVYGNAVGKVKRAVTQISSNSAMGNPDPKREQRTSITRQSFSGSVPLSKEEKAVVMGKITIKQHTSSRRLMSPTAGSPGGELRGVDGFGGAGGGVGALPPGLGDGGGAYTRLLEAVNQVRREVATVRKFQVAQERRASQIDKQAAEDAAVEDAPANVQHV
jgi:hypothetical protein